MVNGKAPWESESPRQKFLLCITQLVILASYRITLSLSFLFCKERPSLPPSEVTAGWRGHRQMAEHGTW